MSRDRLARAAARCEFARPVGTLRGANGLLTARVPAAVGDHCEIRTESGSVLAEVIGFDDGNAFLAPFEPAVSLKPGMPVVRRFQGLSVPAGEGLLGRVLDGLGRPTDGLGPLTGCAWQPIRHEAPTAMERERIHEPFITGVRAVDALLTCGKGQRVAIFAGSGVGKSTLLGEIAKGATSDVNVIALIGERGREVKPFIDDCLGPDGMARSVVIVATCEQTPLMRVRAAQAALAMADWFRTQGKHVLFMVDSLTRLAIAQREMGLAMGEPPSSRGYTPSVFQLLANTVERQGNAATGGITGIMTVLVDGDDLDEPITDAVRSFVDGHICLDRKLANRGHFPAINIAASISRIAHDVTDREHRVAAQKFRAIMTAYSEMEDVIRIGAYPHGADPKTDKAIELMPQVEAFLRQATGERTPFAQTRAHLVQIASAWPFA